MGKLIDKVSTAESYGKDFEEAYSKIDCEKGQGLNRPSDANPAHMIWNPKLNSDSKPKDDHPEDWIPAAVQPIALAMPELLITSSSFGASILLSKNG